MCDILVQTNAFPKANVPNSKRYGDTDRSVVCRRLCGVTGVALG